MTAAAVPDQLGRRVWALFTPYRASLVAIVIAVLLSSGLGIITPFLTQATFDRALFPADGVVRIELLVWLVVGMIAVPVVSALIGVYQTWQTTLLGNRVMADLRGRLFEHLQRMDLAFFTATRTGAIQSRLANDVGGVQSVLSETASSILGNVVTVVAALVAMLLLSWQLTIVAVALVPLFVVLQMRVGRVRRALAGRTQESLSDMTAITEESLSVSGVLLAKVFNRQADEVRRYKEENARQVDLQVRQAMTGQSFFAVVQTFLGVTPALVYLVAGLLIVAGSGTAITAGTIVAFTTLQARLLFPTVNLLRVSLDVQTSLALFGRIFGYLDLVPRIVDAPDARVLVAGVTGRVEFEHVWFAYPSAGARSAWAVRDVSFVVEPGQLAAIVGPSGSGQDHAVVPGAAALRRRSRPRDDRRSGRPRAHPGLGRRRDRHGHPGHVPAALLDRGQPALRQARRHPGRAGGGRAGREHPRPDPVVRRGLRHRGGGARLPAVRRGEAAAGHRAGAPQGPADPHPRRGHQRARHHQRAARAGGARTRDAAAHHDRDRAPALHDPRRRRDPRRRERPDRRERHPRRAARAQRPLRAAVHRAVRGRARSRPAAPTACCSATAPRSSSAVPPREARR